VAFHPLSPCGVRQNFILEHAQPPQLLLQHDLRKYAPSPRKRDFSYSKSAGGFVPVDVMDLTSMSPSRKVSLVRAELLPQNAIQLPLESFPEGRFVKAGDPGHFLRMNWAAQGRPSRVRLA
jgi:hypothetical protein